MTGVNESRSAITLNAVEAGVAAAFLDQQAMAGILLRIQAYEKIVARVAIVQGAQARDREAAMATNKADFEVPMEHHTDLLGAFTLAATGEYPLIPKPYPGLYTDLNPDQVIIVALDAVATLQQLEK